MSFAQSETSDQVRAALGRILRDRREATGRSLADVAETASLSAAHLSEVERGLKDISTDRLLALVHALDLSIADVYVALGRALGSSPAARSWPQDPRLQLRLAAASLSPDALRTVADFTVYLASRQPAGPRRRIGFTAPGGHPGGIR